MPDCFPPPLIIPVCQLTRDNGAQLDGTFQSLFILCHHGKDGSPVVEAARALREAEGASFNPQLKGLQVVGAGMGKIPPWGELVLATVNSAD